MDPDLRPADEGVRLVVHHLHRLVVAGGWFSSAPYLGNEGAHHMLAMLKKKDPLQEFLHNFH